MVNGVITSRRFLNYMREDPARARPIDHLATGYPDWLRATSLGRYFSIQAWPTYIDQDKLREIESATVGVTDLIRTLLARVFANDSRRIADFYAIPDPTLVDLLLEPPNGLPGLVVRHDFIEAEHGFKVLEVNAGSLGGWQMRYFARSFMDHPVLSRFHEEHALRPRHRDPFALLFRHVVLDNLDTAVCAGGTLNLGIAFPPDHQVNDPQELRAFNRLYAGILAADGRGLEGQVRVCSYERMTVRNGMVHENGWPIHAIVEMYPNESEQIFRAFKSGRVNLYPGPLGPLLSDKRNLGLLSRHADSDAFSAAERQLIAKHIPWSRDLTTAHTSFRDASGPLRDILMEHRQDLVIKPAHGLKGMDVHVGRHTSPTDWQSIVGATLGQAGWLAQEFVESKPYLYQAGPHGWTAHDVIWGLFCFGKLYGGAFLRMMPKGTGDGVINSAHGATEGIVLEI